MYGYENKTLLQQTGLWLNAVNQSRIINCKRCLYLYPDIYPSPFSREYHTGKYWFLNKSKSSNLLIINPAEIAQLVEHNLAKVGVASSSLVFRSQKAVSDDCLFCLCRWQAAC